MISRIIKENKAGILLTTLASALAGVINMLLVRLANEYAAGVENAPVAIAYYTLALCTMVAMGMSFQQIMSILTSRIFYQARKTLTEKISQLDFERIEAIGRHRIFSALTNDLNDVNQLATLLPIYIYNATVVAACLFYLSTIAPKLFAIVLLFLLLGVSVSNRYIFRRGEEKFRELRRLQDDLFLCYQGIVDGHKELTLHSERREHFHVEQLDRISSTYRNKTIQAGFFWNLANNWNIGIVFTAIGVVIFVSTFLMHLPSESLLPFVVVILYVTGPTSQLLNGLRVISRGQVAMDRLRKLGIFEDVQRTTKKKTRMPQESFESLRLRSVCYEYSDSYCGDRFTVGPIDMDILRGELIYIVGGNGSGKTTAAKIIAGLYSRSAGEILLNEKLVPRKAPAEYHEHFSAIFSDYHLFETLISKTSDLPDDAEVEAMLEQLQLHGKTGLSGSKIGYTKLSVGLRKRLALMAACFDDSHIYIFDEWAAEQDPEFREYFYRHFLTEMKHRNKTVIVITHDDRYFELADKLIKFDRGKIVSSMSGMALAGTNHLPVSEMDKAMEAR